GNLISAGQGAAEMVGGAGMMGGGAAVCATGVGCLATPVAEATGATVATHGAVIAGSAIAEEATMLGNLVMSTMGRGNSIAAITPPTQRQQLRQNMLKAGNAPPTSKSQAHHNFPWKFRDWFAGAGRGLNVNDAQFGRWVEGTPPGPHQQWTSAYEDAWAEWIGNNPNASRQDVMDFLGQLLSSGRFPSQ
ncbi:MAG: hypothetical protein U0175_27335, partial [Caldilineaceae bacterium]